MSWDKVKLGDISTSIQPGPFGSQLHSSDYSTEGTPIIMPKDMVDGHISHSNLAYISDDHVNRLSRHQVHCGNLMAARKGDVRKCVFITENEEGWMTGSDCLKVALNDEVCVPRYIYYQLRSPFIGKWLETISIGSTMPSINTGLLSSIELYLPPISVQNRISEVLTDYDLIIQNNRKQIKLLEEAAQRLYKEWFIDLRFPSHEVVKIADGVPEGWKKRKVVELTSVLRRGISPTYSDEGEYTVINQKCIRSSVMSLDEARRQEKEYPDEINLRDADTVICSTGTGTLGRVGQVCGDYPATTIDSHVTLVRANCYANLLYHSIKANQEYLMGMGRGSTNQQELYKNVIEEMVILWPSTEIASRFEEIAWSIHCKVTVLDRMVAQFIEARNRLLPELMSGEIEL